jgi:hypothetical protein
MHFLLRQPPSGQIIVADANGEVVIYDASTGDWRTGRLDSDQITNLSSVPGVSVSDALDTLNASGATLVNLPNTVWVAAGSSVAPADQTGNIEAPYTTFAAARAALALIGNDVDKVLVVMPGDYDAEPAFVWDAGPTFGRLTILNGSNLGMQLDQSIGNVLLPALTLASIININGCVLSGNITGTAELQLTNCQKLSGTIAATSIEATNSYLSCAMTLAAIGSTFRDCTTGDISQPGDTPLCLTLLGCNVAGNIVFTANPGGVLMDDFSIYSLLANIKTITNGFPRVAHPVQQAWFGTQGGAAAGTFLGPFSEASQSAENRCQSLFAYPTTVTAMIVLTANAAGAGADMDFNLRRNGVEVATVQITTGSRQAVASGLNVPFELGQLVSVENEDGTAADDIIRVILVG